MSNTIEVVYAIYGTEIPSLTRVYAANRKCPVPVYKLIREFGSYHKFTVKYQEYVDSKKVVETKKVVTKNDKKA